MMTENAIEIAIEIEVVTLIATFQAASVYGLEKSLREDKPKQVEAEMASRVAIESEKKVVSVREIVVPVRVAENVRVARSVGPARLAQQVKHQRTRKRHRVRSFGTISRRRLVEQVSTLVGTGISVPEEYTTRIHG